MERKGQVAVVVGASSGIGRATALEFARRGWHVVAAARRGWALEEVARDCEAAGPRALAVNTDITDENAVEHLAEVTVREFGRIDAWVNNATAASYGKFELTPADAFRRVIEVNVLGYANGARAVLPVFRRQGHGVLINVASVLGKISVPYMSPYVAAKHAVVGLSESLRQELKGTGIEVTCIVPASIDTPFYQQAANFTGRAVKPSKPIFRAEDVARAIVRAAEHGGKEIFVPASGKVYAITRALTPRLTERIARRIEENDAFEDRPTPEREGNLFRPSPGWAQVSGGWREREGSGQAGPTAGLVAVLAAVATVWLALGRARSIRDERLAEGLEAA